MNSKITSMSDIDGKTVTETENDVVHGEAAWSDVVPCVKHPADVQFSPGTRFRVGEIEVELVHCLSLDRMVVRERQTGETRVAVRDELRRVEKAADASALPRIESEYVSEELLAQITAREQALQPYVSSGVLPRVDAHRIAKAFGVSSRTVRRWLRRYQRRGDVTAFIPAQRGARPGERSLDSSVEAIIHFAVTRKLRSGNCSVRSVYEAIRSDCQAIGQDPPARATILDRIKSLKADADVLPTEVSRHVRDRTRLVRGSAEANRALERVEIDHTLVDTHIVDAKDRGPLGRPWLTIAMDVATRVVLGFCLTLESPSRLSVALCLRHAIFPKESWLEAIGAAGPWPMFGRPRLIYTDNGLSVKSIASITCAFS